MKRAAFVRKTSSKPKRTPYHAAEGAIVTSFFELVRAIGEVVPEGSDDLVVRILTDLIESGTVRILGHSGVPRLRLKWS